MKAKKIAELAFHESTSEAEAVAAFLALRRLKGGLSELKGLLSESKSNDILTQTSSWVISGSDAFITQNAFIGCLLAEQMDGKCHIKYGDKTLYGRQKFNITLKYSDRYVRKSVEDNFQRMTK